MCPEPVPGKADGPIRPIPRPILWVISIIVIIAITVITVRPFIYARATVVEPCQGANGSITIQASSGFGPLTFTWFAPGQALVPGSPSQSGLAPGLITVTVSNGVGVFDRKMTFNLGGLQDAGLTGTAPSGFVTGDGAVQVVNVKPAGEACTFSWEDGSTVQDRTGLDAGIYSVTVADATSPSCTLERTHKLLPAYPGGCANWQARNPRVRSLVEWTAPTGAAPFARATEVQTLMSLPGAFMGLNRCTGGTWVPWLAGTSARLLPYLGQHRTGPPVAGKWVNYAPGIPGFGAGAPMNHLAAEFFTARLNLLNSDLLPPALAVRMADAIYIGTPYYGYTVSAILGLAERALMCGQDEGGHDLSSPEFLDLHQALARINDGGFYLACPLCPEVFFERTGILPQGDPLSMMGDVSGDGWRCVGSSPANDPDVDTDGPSPDCSHAQQAFGYIRPCASQRFFPPGQLAVPGFPKNHGGLGLIGLGYLPADTHAESSADGISPDGRVVVGYASTNGPGCGLSRAAVFRGKEVLELQAPPGQISRAHDVTNASVVTIPGGPERPFGPGTRIAVGYISSGGNHPHFAANARAVFWDRSGTPHDLPMPSSPPGGQVILSSNAIAVSDDGSAIAGELFYFLDRSNPRAFACVWTVLPGGAGYGPPLVLQDPAGGEVNARVKHISGNGRVIVGYGSDGGTRAIRWRQSLGTWTTLPDVLPMIPGGEQSFATGVNYDGSVIVGSCESLDFQTHFAARWTGATVANIADLLAPATPPPAGWQLQAVRVSADGRTIAGVGYWAEGQEGWIARIP